MAPTTLHRLRRAFLNYPHLTRLTMWAFFVAALTYGVRSAGLMMSNEENALPEKAVEPITAPDANGNWNANSSAWWNSGTDVANPAAAPELESAPDVAEPTVVISDSQPTESSAVEDLRLNELFPRKSSKFAAISVSGDPLLNDAGLPDQISGGLSGTIGEVFVFQGESTSGDSGASPSLAIAPVPEPSTAMLLACGALGLGLRRRRR